MIEFVGLVSVYKLVKNEDETKESYFVQNGKVTESLTRATWTGLIDSITDYTHALNCLICLVTSSILYLFECGCCYFLFRDNKIIPHSNILKERSPLDLSISKTVRTVVGGLPTPTNRLSWSRLV